MLLPYRQSSTPLHQANRIDAFAASRSTHPRFLPARMGTKPPHGSGRPARAGGGLRMALNSIPSRSCYTSRTGPFIEVTVSLWQNARSTVRFNRRMPLLYEVRYLFTSPRGVLNKIRRLDLPAAATRQQRDQWLWISGRAVASLRLASMQTGLRETRRFREADLVFDEQGAELRWRDGETVTLETSSDRSLDADQQRLIRIHLS